MYPHKMTDDLKRSFKDAHSFALRLNDDSIRLEHLIYSILNADTDINLKLKNFITDYDLLVIDVYNMANKVSSKVKRETSDEDLLVMSNDIKETLKLSAKHTPDDSVAPLDILYVISFHTEFKSFSKLFEEYGLTADMLEDNFDRYDIINENDDGFGGFEQYNPISIPNKTNPKTKTPILDANSRDLTIAAKNGKIDPVLGRDMDIERVSQILTRRKKNNPILVGEPGTGKTSIAEGLALKIVQNDCPIALQNKRVVALDLISLISGTKYRGQFEERIKGIIEEVRYNKDIILFIDEIHTLIGAGNASGGLDAANIFKPALARGELQCIGATTLDEFQKHIEKDGALERRFQKVLINPTTATETLDILKNIKNKYELHHNVIYTEEALEEIVRLCDRYVTNRNFPDKAIDVLDEAGSRTQIKLEIPPKIKELEKNLKELKLKKELVVELQQYEAAAELKEKDIKLKLEYEKELTIWKNSVKHNPITVNDNMISEVVSMMTGIPLNKISQSEIKRIINIDKELSGSIIGQQEAINKVSSAIKRNAAGISRSNRPLASFLFVGPTGVGKSELAKVMADKVYGSSDNLIKIDMSEYGDRFNISKLIGSPPGYVGYDEGGYLTEKVRNQPYSIVLFDEVEKAHPDVLNLLLQILDEGHLVDSNGRNVNFKQSIIIMTSNIGVKKSEDIGTPIGFGSNDLDFKTDVISSEIKKYFRPEILNRIDEIVQFNYLTEDNLKNIVDIEMGKLNKHLKSLGHLIKYDNDVIVKLSKIEHNISYGAREINRIIQKHIENKLSESLLASGLPKKSVITIKVNDDKNDEFKFSVKKVE